MFRKKSCAGDQHGRDRRFIVDQNFSVRLHFEARHPWLDRPHRVELLLLEQRQLIRIGGRYHLRVAAGLRDLQAAGREPGARSDILRVAELRRRDGFAAEIGRCLERGVGLHDQRRATIGAPATMRTSSPRDLA